MSIKEGMTTPIQVVEWEDQDTWDQYVMDHPRATLYHRFGWRKVIERAYRRDAYYLSAIKKGRNADGKDQIIGVLPLIHLKHFLFGTSLISIPYFDMGGVLSDGAPEARQLAVSAIRLGRRLGVDTIEFRQNEPSPPDLSISEGVTIKTDKVRMVLELPETSHELMDSFRSKLRSQIKRPIKSGLESRVGGLELLDDFYKVFSENMRDLGSPVHAKRLIGLSLEEFAENAKIVSVYLDHEPVASSVIVGFRDIMENPWASSLRRYSRLSPNMLLYWTMLEYAADNGYRWFDFGRSSQNEGTYRFKAQWGAQPKPLHWGSICLKEKPEEKAVSVESKFEKAIQYWQKLPVSVTKIIGPALRKHIGL